MRGVCRIMTKYDFLVFWFFWEYKNGPGVDTPAWGWLPDISLIYHAIVKLITHNINVAVIYQLSKTF